MRCKWVCRSKSTSLYVSVFFVFKHKLILSDTSKHGDAPYIHFPESTKHVTMLAGGQHRINTPFRLNIWQWNPTYSSCLLNMGKLTLSSCRKVVKEWKNKPVGMPDCDDAQSGSDSMWHQLLTTHSFKDFHCCLGWWVTVVKRWQASVRWSATGIFRENVCIVVFLFQTLNSGSQFSNSVDNVNVHLSPLLSRYLVELF